MTRAKFLISGILRKFLMPVNYISLLYMYVYIDPMYISSSFPPLLTPTHLLSIPQSLTVVYAALLFALHSCNVTTQQW